LKATKQNGVWNEEIKELRTHVLPPFWLSWYAFVIYFCTFEFGTIQIVNYRKMPTGSDKYFNTFPVDCLNRLFLRNRGSDVF
jgi:hypothetical protein